MDAHVRGGGCRRQRKGENQNDETSQDSEFAHQHTHTHTIHRTQGSTNPFKNSVPELGTLLFEASCAIQRVSLRKRQDEDGTMEILVTRSH